MSMYCHQNKWQRVYVKRHLFWQTTRITTLSAPNSTQSGSLTGWSSGSFKSHVFLSWQKQKIAKWRVMWWPKWRVEMTTENYKMSAAGLRNVYSSSLFWLSGQLFWVTLTTFQAVEGNCFKQEKKGSDKPTVLLSKQHITSRSPSFFCWNWA